MKPIDPFIMPLLNLILLFAFIPWVVTLGFVIKKFRGAPTNTLIKKTVLLYFISAGLLAAVGLIVPWAVFHIFDVRFADGHWTALLIAAVILPIIEVPLALRLERS
jgi:hypothetical protein